MQLILNHVITKLQNNYYSCYKHAQQKPMILPNLLIALYMCYHKVYNPEILNRLSANSKQQCRHNITKLLIKLYPQATSITYKSVFFHHNHVRIVYTYIVQSHFLDLFFLDPLEGRSPSLLFSSSNFFTSSSIFSLATSP